MARYRPNVVFVMGILNIVLGGIWLLITMCGAASNAFTLTTKSASAFNPVLDKMKEVPGFVPFKIADSCWSFLFAIALIVSGIGLIKMKNWARATSVVFSVLSLLEQIGAVIFTFAVISPALGDAMQDQPFSQLMGNSPMGIAIQVAAAAMGMIYPIALLVTMLLPTVRAAFAGRLPPPEPDKDNYDPPEGEEERRP